MLWCRQSPINMQSKQEGIDGLRATEELLVVNREKMTNLAAVSNDINNDRTVTASWPWPEPYPPENCNLNVKKLAILFKKTIFGNFLWKKASFWQFFWDSNGNFTEGQFQVKVNWQWLCVHHVLFCLFLNTTVDTASDKCEIMVWGQSHKGKVSTSSNTWNSHYLMWIFTITQRESLN